MKSYKGINYIIYPHIGSFCAYVQLPEKHKWIKKLKKSYDDVPLDVHGGVTFGAILTKDDVKEWENEQGFTEGAWVGWDYLHSGDAVDFGNGLGMSFSWEHHWTKNEVEAEVKEAIEQVVQTKEAL